MNNLWLTLFVVVTRTVIAYNNTLNGCFEFDNDKNSIIRTADIQNYCITSCKNNNFRFAKSTFEQLCWCCASLNLNNNESYKGYTRFSRDVGSINEVDNFSPPINVQIANITENSVHVSWQKPVHSITTDIIKYQIKTEVLHTYTNEELHSHEWTFSNNTLHSEIGGLHPATQYNISIRTVMANGQYGQPAYAIFETLIGVPDQTPENPQVVLRQGPTMTVRVYPVTNNNGPITSYRLVVIHTERMQVFEPELLAPYHEAQAAGLSYYIAAQLNKNYLSSSGIEFILGDGKNYGGYFNAPLYENAKYIVLMGIVSSSRTSSGVVITQVRYGNETTMSTFSGTSEASYEMSAVVIGLYVAIGLMTVVLVGAIVILFIVRRRYHQGRRQRLSDNQELSLQGPVIEISNNGYIHDEEPINYYNDLKRKVWRIPRHCLQIEQNKILGFGQFGHIVSGSVKQENKSIPSISPVAVYIINDGDMRQDENRAMLRALGMLIKVGQHDNFACLVGTCESIDTVYITWQHEALILKDKLLTSRLHSIGEINFSQLSEHTMLDIAIGVANGMEHLTQNNLVHEKLCARNIYLTKNIEPKITGHGLSSFNRNNIVLDMTRWMAQEVFKGKPVSNKSDVWSFACFMWELFTLGGTPYSQLTDKQSIIHEVSRGVRLPQLSYMGDELHELMLHCWQADADERPSFKEILEQLIYFKNTLTLKGHLSYRFYTGFEFSKFIPELEIQQEHV